MQLVEQHIISMIDSRYAVIDAAAFASKNLFNAMYRHNVFHAHYASGAHPLLGGGLGKRLPRRKS